MSPEPRETISLFVPCVVDQFRPGVARASADVLRKLDLGFETPGPGICCGQPAFNQGFREEARRVARKWIQHHEAYSAVVAPSGSCVNMVRNHYPALFDKEPDWRRRALAVAARTYELTEYLVHVAKRLDLGVQCPLRATYHDSCHVTRHLGVREEPRRLLQHVDGLVLVEMEQSDRCCGFGGLFRWTHAPISRALSEEKARMIEATGVDAVITAETGCLLNIEAALDRIGSRVKAFHVAEVLGGMARA
ncbi:MAG: (Fe-S)-binding protein [Deltaproteobacteria bacterium]|nr:(Fe-S)-binding protein [Deltaproteobacteria bacterium]